jgi:polyferredoxin
MSQYGQGYSGSDAGGAGGGYPLGGYGNESHQEPHRATVILVLAIVGFFFFCGLTCPVAWWMARGDLKKMELGKMDPSGESTTRAGHLLGIIGTVLMVAPMLLSLVVLVIYFVAVLVFGFASLSLGA